MDITYEIIKPILVKEERIDDYQIRVEFRAENQPIILSATAFLPVKKLRDNRRKRLIIGKKASDKKVIPVDELRKKAIVQAFKTLSIFYDYDENSEKWVFKSPY